MYTKCYRLIQVYLYLVNYAESNSDLAILAINTLQKELPGVF